MMEADSSDGVIAILSDQIGSIIDTIAVGELFLPYNVLMTQS
jgi:hypothetical protein